MSGMSINPDIFERVDPTTIQRKFLVGYQGWFTCRGDGAGLEGHEWSHWLRDCDEDVTASGGGRLATDLWPDMSRYPPSEMYPVPGFKHESGDQAFLFSSCNSKTVQRHFNWMASHGIDGVFLQRFVGQCQCDPSSSSHKAILNWRDKVGDNVRLAAEAEGRVYSIMYDVSGVNPSHVRKIIEQDWLHLIRDKCVLDSPNYLHERGKPVVCLWGFGFSKTQHAPDTVKAIVTFLRESTPRGAYIIAGWSLHITAQAVYVHSGVDLKSLLGVPTHWRTADGDSDCNPEFLKLWLNHFDAISPWTVGRYKNEEDATRYANDIMRADIQLVTARNQARQGSLGYVDYIPVVLPGGSGYNMSRGKWAFNNIKREGGRFLWRQIYNATRNGARIIYGATWDEYDEGTALMPAVENKLLLPISHHCPLLCLDEDGYRLPTDWYMRICGLAAECLRGEREFQEEFPLQILQNYGLSRVQLAGQSRNELLPPPYCSSPSGSPPSVSHKIWLTSRQRPTSRPLPPIPASSPILSYSNTVGGSLAATTAEAVKDSKSAFF
ncbi:hypothetical protein J3R30DRAFT_3851264 [Lentinula aciculospora]|uniref:Xylosidase/arabinosidase n=1 Tax=Lentinula aciculospora TaxID=153920 RepID=A0A9W9AHG2_9AGAR|nr:hypothetical protein J3R30DRAFT_3851264 [Lentinula aciculospora]